jgi:hypothetical protein
VPTDETGAVGACIYFWKVRACIYFWKVRSMAGQATGDISAYERERLDNIRKNNLRLQELGLGHRRPAQLPRRLPRPAVKRSHPETVPGERRSSRQLALAAARDAAGAPAPSYLDPDVPGWRLQSGPKGNNGLAGDVDLAAADADIATAAAAIAEREIPEASADSCRTCDIDADSFIARHLGRQLVGPPTKASVVAALAGGHRVPKFSKYSGSLEWRNAVVLWVNVGGADYANLFLDGGRRMSWFASQRHDASSPIVQRLLATNRATGGRRDTLLLFCRLPAEPYVCCGRLAYVSHEPSSSPLRFVWSLLDADQLLESSEPFRLLLAQGGGTAKADK